MPVGSPEYERWQRYRAAQRSLVNGEPAPAQQVADAIGRYAELGIDAFILSGYPHEREAERFAADVLPLLRG